MAVSATTTRTEPMMATDHQHGKGGGVPRSPDNGGGVVEINDRLVGGVLHLIYCVYMYTQAYIWTWIRIYTIQPAS